MDNKQLEEIRDIMLCEELILKLEDIILKLKIDHLYVGCGVREATLNKQLEYKLKPLDKRLAKLRIIQNNFRKG